MRLNRNIFQINILFLYVNFNYIDQIVQIVHCTCRLTSDIGSSFQRNEKSFMSNTESSLMHAYIHASVANYVKLPLFVLLASFLLPMVNHGHCTEIYSSKTK
jgi:hypothetical protein